MEVRQQNFAEINNIKVRTTYKLLTGISSRSTDFQRRQPVRAHQIKPYPNSLYEITWNFVISTPKSQYLEAIRQDINIYGGLIIFVAFNNSQETSRMNKPFE